MEWVKLLVLGGAVVMGAGCAAGREGRVAALLGRNPVGVLGRVVGVREVVTGELAEHSMGRFGVEEVDGVRLKVPVQVDVQGTELKKGVRYTFEGYESGGFVGIPSWANADAQQWLHYDVWFVVTRVVRGE